MIRGATCLAAGLALAAGWSACRPARENASPAPVGRVANGPGRAAPPPADVSRSRDVVANEPRARAEVLPERSSPVVPAANSAPNHPGVAPAAEAQELPLAVAAAEYAGELPPGQTLAMRQLAEDFLRDIEVAPTGEEQSAPVKKKHAKSAWQTAQELNDARFQAMFGQDAFNAMQRERAADAAGAPSSP